MRSHTLTAPLMTAPRLEITMCCLALPSLGLLPSIIEFEHGPCEQNLAPSFRPQRPHRRSAAKVLIHVRIWRSWFDLAHLSPIEQARRLFVDTKHLVTCRIIEWATMIRCAGMNTGCGACQRCGGLDAASFKPGRQGRMEAWPLRVPGWKRRVAIVPA